MNKLFLILLLVVISSSVFAQRSVFTPRQYSVIDSLIDAAVFDSTQVNANFDSLYTKTSHIVKIEEYIGALDTSLGWSFVVQAAVDANLGTGNTLLFNENKVYELQSQKNDPGEVGYKTCIDLKSGGFNLIIPSSTTLKVKDDQQTVAGTGLNIITFANTIDLYIGGGGTIVGNTAGQINYEGTYTQGSPAIINGRTIPHSQRYNKNITVENLRLYDHWGCPVDIEGVDGLILKNLSNYGTGEGFQAVECADVLFDNLYVSDSANTYVGDGIELSGCEYFQAVNCIVRGEGGGGGGSAFDLFGSKYGILTNFIVEEWSTGVNAHFGNNNTPFHEVIISNGQMLRMEGDAIDVQTYGGITYINDIIIDSSLISIQVNGDYNSTVYINNMTFVNSASAVVITGGNKVFLTNSTFDNCEGIYIGNGVTDSIPPEIYIMNNIFKNVQYGFSVNNSGDGNWFPTGVISNNVFHNADDEYLLVPYNILDSVTVDGGNVINMKDKYYYNFGSINISTLPTDTTGNNAGDLYYDDVTGIVYATLGDNLALNGNFNVWENEENRLRHPTYWQTSNPDTNDAYLINNNSRLQFISNGQVPLFEVYTNTAFQDSMISGEVYGYSFDVISWYGDSTTMLIAGNVINQDFAVLPAGAYRGAVTASYLRGVDLFTYGDTANVIIDNVQIWEMFGGDLAAPKFDRVASIPPLNPTALDTVPILRAINLGNVGADSLFVYDVTDSVAVGMFYRDVNGDSLLITTPDTLITDSTIYFDVDVIPEGGRVYLYFVYIGDNVAYFRSYFYWHTNRL